MFKVSQKRTINWPALISVPVEGGTVRTHEVNVEFEDLPQSEQDDVYKGGGNDTDLMKRVIKGWKPGQFTDERDADIEFSPESLVKLLDIAYVQAALVRAYIELHSGRAAVRKN